MIRAGITGGLGSGKSLVCSMLAKLGAAVYNADMASKILLDKDPELREKIILTFGNNLYKGPNIDRKAFAALIFNDETTLQKANSIIHPFVYADFECWVSERKKEPVVFLESAILFESGGTAHIDRIVLVWAEKDLRIKRAMERDQATRESILDRMKYQLEDELKKQRADYILDNSGIQPLLPQVLKLWVDLNR